MNESQLNLLLEFNDEYSKNLWPNTLYSLLCLVIGLFGNGYVLLIYNFKMKDKTESRYFIPHLAVADACASVFSCIAFILINFYPLYFPWDFLCKGINYLSFVPGFASALFLLGIAVQRYTRSKPFGRPFSLFWRRTTVVVIWIVTICIEIPSFLFAGVAEIEFVYKGVNISSINCQARNDQYLTLQNIFYGCLVVGVSANILSIFILYICIAVVVYRRNKKTRLSLTINKSGKEGAENPKEIELDAIEPLTGNITGLSSMDHSKDVICRKVGKSDAASPSTQFNEMFLTIVVAYVMTYVPAGVILGILISKADTDSAVFLLGFPVWKLQIISIIERTWVINNIVDPFIYGYFDMEFRKYLKKILPPFCRRKV